MANGKSAIASRRIDLRLVALVTKVASEGFESGDCQTQLDACFLNHQKDRVITLYLSPDTLDHGGSYSSLKGLLGNSSDKLSLRAPTPEDATKWKDFLSRSIQFVHRPRKALYNKQKKRPASSVGDAAPILPSTQSLEEEPRAIDLFRWMCA